MAYISFNDFKNRFIKIDRKLSEFLNIQEERECSIKSIEDETNHILEEHNTQEAALADNYLEHLAQALDATLAYAEQLINNIYNAQLRLDPKVPNSKAFQNIGKQKAASIPLSYAPRYSDNTQQLEQLDEQISRKISLCTQNEGSLLGFGKKITGLNNSLYVEIYTMIYQAYNFYDGLQGYFDHFYEAEKKRLYDDHNGYYTQICKKADSQVAKTDKIFNEKTEQWISEFEQFLDVTLPLSYLQELECIYKEALYNSSCIAEEHPTPYIPLGKLYFDFTNRNIPEWEKIQNLIQKKYTAYIQDGYLFGYVSWNRLENKSLIFTNYETPGNSNACNKVLESCLLQNIISAPAGEFSFTICSASGLINEYKTLSSFITRFPKISGGKIITDKQEIRNILDRYVRFMDETIQKKLKGYTSLEDFNIQNPKQKIPYRCLCITGFPAHFDEPMLEGIFKLQQQGYRAGIQTIIQYEDKYYQQGHQDTWMKTIMYVDYQFYWVGYTWQNTVCHNSYLEIVQNITEQTANDIFNIFEHNYIKEQNKPLRLADIMDTHGKYNTYSGELLRIPFGINEYGDIQYLEMGDPVANGTSHYAIIAGPTGSGKSALLHTIIMSSLLSYSPDELQLYMMDFKGGSEFKIYEERNIPHIRCIALDAMQDFGESILNKLWDILEKRNDMFTQASMHGAEIKNISDYRKAGYQMSRILVIIDEFQVLFDRDQNKRIADRCASKMSSFISQARVYGIHFIFATQTMHKLFEGNYSISKSTLEEMHIRIGLQCQPKEIELLFGDMNYNTCMQKRSGRKGSAIYLENDIVSQPVKMQVAYVNPETQRQLLNQIEMHFKESNHEKMIIFRGNSEPTFSEEYIRMQNDCASTIYLGEPISIADAVKVTINLKQRTNLLVIGENEAMINRIEKLWIYQAAVIHDNTTVYLFDGGQMIGEAPLIKDPIFPTIKVIDNVFQVIPTIDAIYEIYSDRKQHMIKGKKVQADDAKIHMVVSNYQWVEPLIRLMEKKNVSEFTDTNEGNSLDGLLSILNENDSIKSALSPSQKLYTLLESGYLYGIQIVFTCTEIGQIKKLTSSELLPFTNRMLLKTSSSSWYTLIDSDINMKNIRDNTVLYSDGIHPPYLFKPYKIDF